MFRSGYVGIVGRPNVGKSTLLNAIVGQKVAIVTRRPQTTRNRLTGIRTFRDCQMIFVDTPGLHAPENALGELMVGSALNTMKDVDVIVLVVTPRMPNDADVDIARRAIGANPKTLLVLNKIDTVRKDAVLPVMSGYARLGSFSAIVPVSARKGDGVKELVEVIKSMLPEGPALYPDDATTDQIERFMIAEIIREKIMLRTHDEIPHSVAVEVARWREDADRGLISIGGNVYVERESQKGIIIGNRGSMIKAIGSEARREIEALLGIRIYLELLVKVKKDWRKDTVFLRTLGFT